VIDNILPGIPHESTKQVYATVDLHLDSVSLYCFLKVILFIMFVHSKLQQPHPENYSKEAYMQIHLKDVGT
jgi:hypothetical protein